MEDMRKPVEPKSPRAPRPPKGNEEKRVDHPFGQLIEENHIRRYKLPMGYDESHKHMTNLGWKKIKKDHDEVRHYKHSEKPGEYITVHPMVKHVTVRHKIK
jgi:hypothetical protein